MRCGVAWTTDLLHAQLREGRAKGAKVLGYAVDTLQMEVTVDIVQFVGGIGSGKVDSIGSDKVRFVLRAEPRFICVPANVSAVDLAVDQMAYTLRRLWLTADKYNAGQRTDHVAFMAPDAMSDHEAVLLLLDKARRFDAIEKHFPEVAARHK